MGSHLRRNIFRWPAASVLAMSLCLSSCDKLTTNGQSDTMTLLKSGSERVCIAPDVQKALRELILPKADAGPPEDAQKLADAISALNIGFELTTLQSADRTVNRATCNTSAKMAQLNGDSSSFSITYDISPSAERPGSFVVTGNVNEARTFASNAVGNTIAHQVAAEQVEKEAADAEQAHQKLLAVTTPRWLIGTWVSPTEAPIACSVGASLTFDADHTVRNRVFTARWDLSDAKIHLVGSTASGGLDKTMVITEADAVSFEYEGQESGALRRCTPDEVSNTGLPDVVAPPPEPTPS